jgi:DNA excision repair protein ERCC-1
MSADNRQMQPPNQTGNPRAVQQPKPQPLSTTGAAGSSSILVSHRQKGNPILTHIRSIPWEYSDIPADFVLGATTCVLFLQLKYHKLHPEYIYTRIRGLQGRYQLRLVLVLVDIEAHEESIKELTKTSVVNNVTVLLSWSAREAGRYLELFKSYEHAAPTAIKGVQSDSYMDRLAGVVTAPRGINRADAVGLVSNFGTLRTAVNAEKEEISMVGGWGEVKVARWHAAVREPFKSKVASRKILKVGAEEEEDGLRPELRQAMEKTIEQNRIDHEERTPEITSQMEQTSTTSRKRPASPEADDGVMAALARLRHLG